jgi:hypothetical protein
MSLVRARRSLVAMVGVLASCGRVGFDDAARARDGGRDSQRGDAADDAAGDAAALVDAFDPARCDVGTTAPDPIEVSGTVVYFTDFTGDYETIGGATLALAAGSAVIGSTTSGSDGSFDLDVDTHGMPARFTATVSKTGYFTTVEVADLPVAANQGGTKAEITDGGAMGSVYDAASVTRDTSAGTLVIQGIDCSNAAVAGLTFAVTPAPGSFAYTGSDGLPGATETTLPFGNAVAYNAQPVPTRVDVFAAGVLQLQFEAIPVTGGDAMTVAVVHVQ